MWFEHVLFFVAAIGALGGALGVVILQQPLLQRARRWSATCSALAVLFLLLHAEFLAAAQVVVYAGAVMVLYVFVVAYIGGVGRAAPARERRRSRSSGRCSRAALAVELCIAFIAQRPRGARHARARTWAAGFGSPGAIGELLLTHFLIPFEAASFLLLIAAVGAVVLARRRAVADGSSEASHPLRPR